MKTFPGSPERPHEPTVSDRLAHANSLEQRYEIFEDQFIDHHDQFDADCETTAKALNSMDAQALIEHGERHTRERAVARAAVIREVSPPEA